MRRVVFDCDRCGKRDLPDVFSLYSREGEGEEHLLDDEARLDLIIKVGHKDPIVESLTFDTLRSLQDGLGWLHYCRRCFMYVSDNLAKVANVKKPARAPKPRLVAAAADPLKLGEGSVEPTPEPVPEPVPEPAPESVPDSPPEPAEAKPKARPKAKAKPKAKTKVKDEPKLKPKAQSDKKTKKKGTGDLQLSKA